MKSRPVLVGNSVLATLQVLAGGAALGEVVGPKTFGLFALLVAAITVGFNVYVQGIVTPFQDVAAYANSSGNMVAGPAAGATRGTPVTVEPGTMLEGNLGEHLMPDDPNSY